MADGEYGLMSCSTKTNMNAQSNQTESVDSTHLIAGLKVVSKVKPASKGFRPVEKN